MKYINKDAFWDAMEKEELNNINELAYVTYLSQSQIWRIIKLDRIFRISTLYIMAECLNVNPGDLLLDRKEMGEGE